jgi:hypothetical protein
MALLLDPEAARRDAGREPVAGADLRLPGAADFGCVFDNVHGDARSGARGAKPIDRRQRRIDLDDVVATHLADGRAAAEVHIGIVEKRPELLDALRPQFNAMHIIICHLAFSSIVLILR